MASSQKKPCAFAQTSLDLATWYFLRKEGDSNPRYGYPYDSLANCWFQPLTHPSSHLCEMIDSYYLNKLPNESGCKGTAFF